MAANGLPTPDPELHRIIYGLHGELAIGNIQASSPAASYWFRKLSAYLRRLSKPEEKKS